MRPRFTTKISETDFLVNASPLGGDNRLQVPPCRVGQQLVVVWSAAKPWLDWSQPTTDKNLHQRMFVAGLQVGVLRPISEHIRRKIFTFVKRAKTFRTRFDSDEWQTTTSCCCWWLVSQWRVETRTTLNKKTFSLQSTGFTFECHSRFYGRRHRRCRRCRRHRRCVLVGCLRIKLAAVSLKDKPFGKVSRAWNLWPKLTIFRWLET